MNELTRAEYESLRATIRERGTVRAITFLITFIAWAALLLAFAAAGPRNIIGSLLSLMVLAAGFEVIFQIHLGVERVGRYLQVAYEEAGEPALAAGSGGPGWETTAMAYGRSYPAAGSDALFSVMFVLATFVNLLPVLQAWRVPFAFAAVVVPHLAFLVRVRVARHVAGLQRAQDLARFRELRGRREDAGSGIGAGATAPASRNLTSSK